MSQRTVTLSLPDNLASEAEAIGLLRPETIELLLREELRRRRIDRLFEAANELANAGFPALSEGEIEAEIQAAREARRASYASGS